MEPLHGAASGRGEFLVTGAGGPSCQLVGRGVPLGGDGPSGDSQGPSHPWASSWRGAEGPLTFGQMS